MTIKIPFEMRLKSLCDVADTKQREALAAVGAVTKLIQTKYPELRAEWTASDSGIIYIDDSDMSEYYSLKQVVERFGRR